MQIVLSTVNAVLRHLLVSFSCWNYIGAWCICTLLIMQVINSQCCWCKVLVSVYGAYGAHGECWHGQPNIDRRQCRRRQVWLRGLQPPTHQPSTLTNLRQPNQTFFLGVLGDYQLSFDQKDAPAQFWSSIKSFKVISVEAPHPSPSNPHFAPPDHAGLLKISHFCYVFTILLYRSSNVFFVSLPMNGQF